MGFVNPLISRGKTGIWEGWGEENRGNSEEQEKGVKTNSNAITCMKLRAPFQL